MLGETERILVQDVHEAVQDFVQVIQTYKSKNRFTQVLTSSLFKRRWAEAEALVDRAILHLHVSWHFLVCFPRKAVDTKPIFKVRHTNAQPFGGLPPARVSLNTRSRQSAADARQRRPCCNKKGYLVPGYTGVLKQCRNRAFIK